MIMRIFMTLCLMLLVVQPWKLPIEGLKTPFIIKVTQGALGSVMNEEETKEKAKRTQTTTEKLPINAGLGSSKLQTETRSPFPTSPFIEVPTPPPRA